MIALNGTNKILNTSRVTGELLKVFTFMVPLWVVLFNCLLICLSTPVPNEPSEETLAIVQLSVVPHPLQSADKTAK